MKIDMTDLQKDALKELFNISVGRAAKVMSELAKKEIILSVPQLVFLSKEEVIKLQGINSLNVCSVNQYFYSNATGNGLAFLVFPADKILDIVRIMIGDEMLDLEMTDLESEAMTEIGNIIINSCLGTIANITNTSLEFKLPTFYKGAIEKLILSEKASESFTEVVAVYIDYSIGSELSMGGYILFMFDGRLIEFLTSSLIKEALS